MGQGHPANRTLSPQSGYDYKALPRVEEDEGTLPRNMRRGQFGGSTDRRLVHPTHYQIAIDEEEYRMWDAQRFRDVFIHFFEFLPLGDRSRCACVSRHWRNTCYEPALWQELNLNRIKFRVSDELVARLLRSPRFRQLSYLSFEGCAAIGDRSIYAICTVPSLQKVDLSGCDLISERAVVHMAKELKNLEHLELTDTKLDVMVTESLARVNPRLEQGSLWLKYCAKSGRHGPPPSPAEAKCRFEGRIMGRGCWGPVKGTVVYSNQVSKRRNGFAIGNYPVEVVYVCSSHEAAHAVDTSLYKCMNCMKTFRRESVWTEQSVCKVCVDVEILIEGTKFLDLRKQDWKLNLAEATLPEQVAVCDPRNLPESLRFYGKNSYRIPGSRNGGDYDGRDTSALDDGKEGVSNNNEAFHGTLAFPPPEAKSKTRFEKKMEDRIQDPANDDDNFDDDQRSDEKLGKIVVLDAQFLELESMPGGYANAWDTDEADKKIVNVLDGKLWGTQRDCKIGSSEKGDSHPQERNRRNLTAEDEVSQSTDNLLDAHGAVRSSQSPSFFRYHPTEVAMENYASLGNGNCNLNRDTKTGHVNLDSVSGSGQIAQSDRKGFRGRALTLSTSSSQRQSQSTVDNIIEQLENARRSGETRALLCYNETKSEVQVFADKQPILKGHREHEYLSITQQIVKNAFLVLYPFVVVMLVVVYFKTAHDEQRAAPREQAVNNRLSEGRSRGDGMLFILIFAMTFLVAVMIIICMIYRFRAFCERLFRRFLVIDILMIYLFGGSSMIMIALSRLQLSVGLDTFLMLSWNLACGGLVALYLRIPETFRRFYLVVLSAIMAVMMVITLPWFYILSFLCIGAILDLVSGCTTYLRLIGEFIGRDRDLLPFVTPRIFYEVPGLRFRFANLFVYGLMVGCLPIGASVTTSGLVPAIAGLVLGLFILPFYGKTIRPYPLSMILICFFVYTHYLVIRPYARSLNRLYPFV
mmetsp:Transcript_25951/g.62514  ORF Transcript_25951/g.62514 Transcript_25951/m.62514 type:complete len:975 (-) Transcript_25951:290-3214(-)